MNYLPLHQGTYRNPFREAEFDILYDRGIDRAGELIDLAIEHGVLQRAGSRLKLGDTVIGNGRDKVRDIVENDDELRSKIEAELQPIFRSTQEPS